MFTSSPNGGAKEPVGGAIGHETFCRAAIAPKHSLLVLNYQGMPVKSSNLSNKLFKSNESSMSDDFCVDLNTL